MAQGRLYTWTSSAPGSSNSVAFSPTTTANYTVVGTNTLTGCTSTNNAVVTINGEYTSNGNGCGNIFGDL